MSRLISGAARLKLRNGTTESAEQNLLTARELVDEIGSPRLLWDVHAALVELYAALENDELRAEHEENVQSIVHQIYDDLVDPELRRGLPQN